MPCSHSDLVLHSVNRIQLHSFRCTDSRSFQHPQRLRLDLPEFGQKFAECSCRKTIMRTESSEVSTFIKIFSLLVTTTFDVRHWRISLDNLIRRFSWWICTLACVGCVYTAFKNVIVFPKFKRLYREVHCTQSDGVWWIRASGLLGMCLNLLEAWTPYILQIFPPAMLEKCSEYLWAMSFSTQKFRRRPEPCTIRSWWCSLNSSLRVLYLFESNLQYTQSAPVYE